MRRCPSNRARPQRRKAFSLKEVQNAVRSFRQALERGERPAIEVFVPTGTVRRREFVLELVHEEMEFRLKEGEDLDLRSFLDRFPELADDPDAIDELVAAESDLRRRVLDSGSDRVPRRRPDEPGGPSHRPRSAVTSWGT